MVRSRAFSDARKFSAHKVSRNTGLLESSSLECPSPRSSRSFSSASSIQSKPNTAFRKFGTGTIPKGSSRLNAEIWTSSWSSSESCYDIEDSQEEEVLCLMPTGIILEINVHPDDIISNIKQHAISTAMNNGEQCCFIIIYLLGYYFIIKFFFKYFKLVFLRL